jgi:hypothetical protein
MSSEEFSPKPTDLDIIIEKRKKELNDRYRDLCPYDLFIDNLFKVFDLSRKKTDKTFYALIDINSFYLVFINLNDKQIYHIRTSYLRKFSVRDPTPEEVITIREAVERHYKEIGLM